MMTADAGTALRRVAAPYWGQQREGVAPGGPADQFAAAMANRLVGNDETAALFEIPLSKGRLHTDQDLHVAITGAPFRWSCNGESLANHRSHHIAAGSELAWQGGDTGFRSYLAVQGGVGPAIDARHFTTTPLQAYTLRQRKPWSGISRGLWRPQVIRILPGPEASEVTTGYLCGHAWQVSRQSDAQGLRLLGAATAPVLPSIASAPVLDGTVQLTPAGPIVLMRERQTVGGYPRIAQVVGSDINLLAQYRPGQRFRFQPVSLEQALALEHAWQQRWADACEEKA